MKPLHTLLLLPLAWVLAGCPVSVDYPLGTPGLETVDQKLIGNWSTTDTTAEVMTVRITAGEANMIHAKVLKRGTNFLEDADDYKGWCTELNGRKFVYFQSESDYQAGYYSYTYTFEAGKLLLSDFNLKVGGVDAVTSTENYRKEVAASMQFSDFIASTIVYTKR